MNKYNSHIHHRRSIRLQGYDYSQNGAYFVTICTQNRECLLGEIVDGEMRLNDAGVMVKTVWGKLSERFPLVSLGESVIMPNHMHGIICIVGAPLVGAQNSRTGTESNRAPTRGAPTLGDITGAFKSITTHEYIKGVKEFQWRPFPGKLWQRNYFDHIIRNDESMNKIREYIIQNPLKWLDDIENPEVEDRERVKNPYAGLFELS